MISIGFGGEKKNTNTKKTFKKPKTSQWTNKKHLQTETKQVEREME